MRIEKMKSQMSNGNRILAFLFVLILFSASASGQRLTMKTNLLYDLTATINLGLEVAVAPHWSIDLTGNYNPWEFRDYRKQKQWMIQPEGRYWLKQALDGHFFGLHLMTGVFNMADPFFPFNLYPCLRDTRYEGNFYGAGIGYGYQWAFSHRWRLEAELGIGYMGTKYDGYECIRCGTIRTTGYSNSFALTKFSLAIVVLLF